MIILNNKESQALRDEIFAGLKKSGEVKVTGLGIFVVKQRAARQGVNPKTGEKIKIAARKVVKFRASKTLKETVL